MFSNVSPNNFKEWYNYPIFLVDSDVLIDIAKNGKSKIVSEKLLENKAILLYSVTSIMEIGFGSSNTIDPAEISMYRYLYSASKMVNRNLCVTDFRSDCHRNLHKYIGQWIAVIPDIHNWFAAKQALITCLTDRPKKIENAKQLQIDFLLTCAAWNARALIWSNNIKHHLLANYYVNFKICNPNHNKSNPNLSKQIAQMMPPIIDSDLMQRIIKRESFNIYSELKKKMKDRKIIEILSIAEQLN